MNCLNNLTPSWEQECWITSKSSTEPGKGGQVLCCWLGLLAFGEPLNPQKCPREIDVKKSKTFSSCLKKWKGNRAEVLSDHCFHFYVSVTTWLSFFPTLAIHGESLKLLLKYSEKMLRTNITGPYFTAYWTKKRFDKDLCRVSVWHCMHCSQSARSLAYEVGSNQFK